MNGWDDSQMTTKCEKESSLLSTARISCRRKSRRGCHQVQLREFMRDAAECLGEPLLAEVQVDG
jgi:hypothetical protein